MRTFRASHALDQVQASLGLLGDLPGKFIGNGFNLIARPDRQNNPPFFLEINGTQETLEFTNIGGDIPNRGSIESDLILHGLSYVQSIADCADNTGIHFEPGLWLHVPATAAPDPASAESYVRQAVIPHGSAPTMQSTFAARLAGAPLIDPVSSTPFTGDIPDLNAEPETPITDVDYLKQYQQTPLPTGCLPAGLDGPATIKNPALVLQAALTNQTITETVVLKISTTPAGGVVNIPFVERNASAEQVDAIFWIEKVADPTGGPNPYIQLQYVQRVLLKFIDIYWPHISVATLVKTL